MLISLEFPYLPAQSDATGSPKLQREYGSRAPTSSSKERGLTRSQAIARVPANASPGMFLLLERGGVKLISTAFIATCLMFLVPTAMVEVGADSPPLLDEIVESYDAGIVRTRSLIESLSVSQIMVEPQKDGSNMRARAVLTYVSGKGMKREELSSELLYPVGRYTLESLTGPELGVDEYSLVLSGTEDMEGTLCYRIEVTAVARDMHHFDGTVWISVADHGPVRVVGEIANPPFPVIEITLDKSFVPHGNGMWLVARHSGEVEANLLLGRKRALRHIFYEGYSIVLIEQP